MTSIVRNIGFNSLVYRDFAGSVPALHCLQDQVTNILPRSDHLSADSTSSAQCLLGSHEHVGNILVLAQQWDVEQDLQGLAVSCQDHELGLTSVEGLGGLVGALPQLLVVGGLLNKIEDLGSQGLVGEGVSFGIDFLRHDWLMVDGVL